MTKNKEKDFNQIIVTDQIIVILEKIKNKEKLIYEDMLELIKCHFELEFYYHKKHYGITFFDGYEIYEWNELSTLQVYSTYEEFLQNANIENTLLKDAYKDINRLKLM